MSAQLSEIVVYFEYIARVALVVWAVWGLVITIRTPEQAFVFEGKWPKKAWLAIFIVSALMFALFPWRGLGILMLVAVVVIGVFFADVRPAVAGYRNERR